MSRLIDEITAFLEDKGFPCSHMVHDGSIVIRTHTVGGHPRTILPLEITATSDDEARTISGAVSESIRSLEEYPLIITEDRWNSQRSMTTARLLAHLEVHQQAFARNCVVRRIEKAQAQEFLDAHHSYGSAACRYRYGLFLMRQTGHLAGRFPVEPGMTGGEPGMTGGEPGMTGGESGMTGGEPGMTGGEPGMLVAVATFSNARKWVKGDKEIRSYEWTRYASLPGLRISGGMGKMLKTFIKEVQPDDIMSYADLEWSEGGVYSQLGFELEGQKEPVMFTVDPSTWKRSPVKPPVIPGLTGNLFFRNFGSNKYRLKLTEYE